MKKGLRRNAIHACSETLGQKFRFLNRQVFWLSDQPEMLRLPMKLCSSQWLVPCVCMRPAASVPDYSGGPATELSFARTVFRKCFLDIFHCRIRKILT